MAFKNPYIIQQTMKVYYRTHTDKKPKLRQINVTTDDHELALSSVASQLKMDMEDWIKPMLVVVQGGKA